MSFLSKTALILSVGLISSAPAFADITGPEVWRSWKDYLQDVGFDVSASESQSGEVLNVTDVVLSIADIDEANGAELIMNKVTFEDQPNGNVVIRLPKNVPIAMTSKSAFEGLRSITGNVSQENAQLVVSGDVGNLTYQYTIPRIGIVIDGFPGSDEMAVNADFVDLVGTAQNNDGASHQINQSGTASTVNVDMRMKDGSNRSNTAQFQLSGLTFDYDLAIPKDVSEPSYENLIAAGMAVSSNLMVRLADGSITSTDPGGRTVVSSTSNDVRMNASTSATGVQYDISYPGTAITLQTPLFPFSIGISGAQTSMMVAMPAVPSEEPDNFAIQVNLQDYMLSEQIWALFDPTGQIARDPVALAIDVTGKVRRKKESTPAQLTSPVGDDWQTFNINRLEVSGAGAKLDGAGAFTFDNTDIQTFNGFPRPRGEMDVQLKGGTALLGKLVQVGLVPQQQVMLAQMFLGMFTVPIGDDHIATKFEFTPEGRFLVNGQPLR